MHFYTRFMRPRKVACLIATVLRRMQSVHKAEEHKRRRGEQICRGRTYNALRLALPDLRRLWEDVLFFFYFPFES